MNSKNNEMVNGHKYLGISEGYARIGVSTNKYTSWNSTGHVNI